MLGKKDADAEFSSEPFDIVACRLSGLHTRCEVGVVDAIAIGARLGQPLLPISKVRLDLDPYNRGTVALTDAAHEICPDAANLQARKRLQGAAGR